jgi:hydroxymethylpyrimidine kinase/phosphomethylpyrimidine kinase/thiamine-phosphate diphosphorylase
MTVLTIAGSDSGGGAGVQASLRTFAALGAFGASVVTAITAQNSTGVSGVWPVSPAQLAAQLEAVGADFALHAVQIGMLGSAAAVDAVADFLVRFRPPHVVLDPVLASTGGTLLLDDAGQARLIGRLLPLVDLVTPNLPEASALSGLIIEDDVGMAAAGRWFLEQGARAVLVKGGHSQIDPRDLLLQAGEPPLWIEGKRVQVFRRSGVQVFRRSAVRVSEVEGGSGVHGTGCVLAAAIAARLAQGRDLAAAVGDAKRFVEAAIRGAATPGRGRPSAEPMAGAALFAPAGSERHTARLAGLQGLYVVTDSTLRPDRDAAAVAAAASAGGACAVQLRERRLATPALLTLARELAARAAAANVLFLVNDRVDIALAAGADGAHVGPDDLPPADARRLLGPDRLLGVSVGTVEEAHAAAPHASYFGVGPIFGSRTKSDAGPAVTPARIAEIRAAVPEIPVVAIGGIDAGNIATVAAAGAAAAAVVSAVVTAPDMTAAVRDLVERFGVGLKAAPH